MLCSLIDSMSILSDTDDETVWFDTLVGLGRQHGFEYTTFMILPRPGMSLDDVFMRSNYPAVWRRNYERQGFIRIDPTVKHCLMHSRPLIWSSSLFTESAERVLYEQASAHGIRAGVAFPIHGANQEAGMLCFASGDEPANGVWNEVAAQLPALSLLRDVAFDSALKYLGSHSQARIPKLTPRELECLKWTASGKSTWEIARILGCSEATVNFHIMNVRKKFGVHSRGSAALKAARMGLLEPA